MSVMRELLPHRVLSEGRTKREAARDRPAVGGCLGMLMKDPVLPPNGRVLPLFRRESAPFCPPLGEAGEEAMA